METAVMSVDVSLRSEKRISVHLSVYSWGLINKTDADCRCHPTIKIHQAVKYYFKTGFDSAIDKNLKDFFFQKVDFEI
jgi:hypothetical protein